MQKRNMLAVSAVLGILAACAKQTPEANAPSGTESTTTAEKASCGGPDHTDKNHCQAKAKCSGADHTEKGHCAAAAPAPGTSTPAK
ncbi:hypothetical protein [Pendulispora albinea]|uniref:Lipoprotein n=1 Tax=Pendulispora albinea TaxID=2741071 RepID=A0ABZ2LVE7_9BACT